MKVVEIYESIQGEGPHVGSLTTFVRFGGCNLRCPGWGEGELPDGTIVNGCDTIFAVYPEFRHTWNDMSAAEIIANIHTENVTLTGGEPFIQRSNLSALRLMLIEEGHSIDVFTNGSQLFPSWVRGGGVTLIVDYKLPGSEEYGAFNFDNLLTLTLNKDAIKFVCKDERDFETAVEDINMYGMETRAQIYFGVVWNGQFTLQELSDMIMEHAPYGRLNIQTHNVVWPALERRR